MFCLFMTLSLFLFGQEQVEKMLIIFYLTVGVISSGYPYLMFIMAQLPLTCLLYANMYFSGKLEM